MSKNKTRIKKIIELHLRRYTEEHIDRTAEYPSAVISRIAPNGKTHQPDSLTELGLSIEHAATTWGSGGPETCLLAGDKGISFVQAARELREKGKYQGICEATLVNNAKFAFVFFEHREEYTYMVNQNFTKQRGLNYIHHTDPELIRAMVKAGFIRKSKRQH